MSTPIKEFMTAIPHTVGHDMPIKTASDMMDKYSCHHLPVLDGGNLVGILSTSDIQRSNQLQNFSHLKVEDVMTEEPMVVEPTLDVFQAAVLMHEKKIGSVIISADIESPWGIFTATDALRYFTKRSKND